MSRLYSRKAAGKCSKKILKKNINAVPYLSPSSSFSPDITVLLNNMAAL
jgi:hypothetical protein